MKTCITPELNSNYFEKILEEYNPDSEESRVNTRLELLALPIKYLPQVGKTWARLNQQDQNHGLIKLIKGDQSEKSAA